MAPKSTYELVFDSFLKLIEKKINEDGWKQSEVAQAVGVKQPMISMWLGGKRGKRIPYQPFSRGVHK